MPEWEKVNGNTLRLRLDGGWLYMVVDGGAMCFVPDFTPPA